MLLWTWGGDVFSSHCFVSSGNHHLWSPSHYILLRRRLVHSSIYHQHWAGGASLVAQAVKNLPAMQQTRVWPLGQEDLLEKGMETHSSILVWRVPWTEESSGLQSKTLSLSKGNGVDPRFLGIAGSFHKTRGCSMTTYLLVRPCLFFHSCLVLCSLLKKHLLYTLVSLKQHEEMILLLYFELTCCSGGLPWWLRW